MPTNLQYDQTQYVSSVFFVQLFEFVHMTMTGQL